MFHSVPQDLWKALFVFYCYGVCSTGGTTLYQLRLFKNCDKKVEKFQKKTIQQFPKKLISTQGGIFIHIYIKYKISNKRRETYTHMYTYKKENIYILSHSVCGHMCDVHVVCLKFTSQFAEVCLSKEEDSYVIASTFHCQKRKRE